MSLRISGAQAKRLGLTAKPKKPENRHAAETARRALIDMYCRAHGIEPPDYEVRFHPTRMWRADMCFQGWLMVEQEGLAQGGGRHQRIAGFLEDLDKYNAMTVLGYRLLRFTRKQIDSGVAFQTIKEALGQL